MRPKPTDALAMEVDRRLEAFYGPPQPRSPRDPLAELILTILSQNTSDRNSLAAEASLLGALPTWEEVAAAPTPLLEATIRTGGLSNLKAARIKSVLAEIRSREGALNLDRLRTLPLPEVLAYLTSIPGVGPKTAACVALFSLDLPAFPVDTHVRRVAQRLGLIGPTDHLATAHTRLAEAVPPDRRYAFHVHLIELGRQVCQARRPHCELCPLADICAHASAQRATPRPTGR